ncbi:MAG: hypothetical protein ACKVJX_08875 [Verrucomicrobiia bacterium]|jgi:hypothetical protein|tara:strand:- start:41 stop:454 length:414 start_codon:yes stop_codon:yes gene_type:complete
MKTIQSLVLLSVLALVQPAAAQRPDEKARRSANMKRMRERFHWSFTPRQAVQPAEAPKGPLKVSRPANWELVYESHLEIYALHPRMTRDRLEKRLLSFQKHTEAAVDADIPKLLEESTADFAMKAGSDPTFNLTRNS